MKKSNKTITLNQIQLKTLQSKGLLKLYHRLNTQTQWIINGEYYEFQNYSSIFENILNTSIHSLRLWENNQPQILHSICIPSYLNLIALKITGNNIVSIQALSFLNAPCLQQLNLIQNHITCLQPLVKLQTHNMFNIQVQKNNLIKPQNFIVYLSRSLNLNKNQLKLELQAKTILGQHYQEMQCQDLIFLFKLNASFLVIFRILYEQRVPQLKVRQARTRKNFTKIKYG